MSFKEARNFKFSVHQGFCLNEKKLVPSILNFVQKNVGALLATIMSDLFSFKVLKCYKTSRGVLTTTVTNYNDILIVYLHYYLS